MGSRHCLLEVLLVLALFVLALCPRAVALPAPVGVQAGHAIQAAQHEQHKTKGSAPCSVEVPVIGGVLSEATTGICEAASEAAAGAGGLLGEAAGAAGNGVMDALASWMIGAASTIAGFVASTMTQTTTPQLQSAWYEAQFAPMADLGAALGLLVALIAFASAAIRRSPEALAGALAGIVRAGLGTSLAVALTVIGLDVCDQISSAVLSGSPHAFWGTVAHAWGTSGFGGFGSSALACVIALIEVFAAIFVWLELIVCNAAIYVAVLFFPVVLAASIWPALGSWTGRLVRLLMLFVILKPVALIVLSLAGNAAAAGLSFGNGIPSSVGTILAATVIFALAAFAPRALMYLLAADAESAYIAAGLRTAAAAAVNDGDGRSLPSAGALRNLSGQDGAGGAGGPPPGGGGGSSGGDGGGGGRGDGGGPYDGGPLAGGEGGAGVTGDGAGDGALAVGGETTAAGAVAVAAGVSAPAPAASARDSQGSAAHAPSPRGSASHASAQDDSEKTAPSGPARSAASVPAARDDGASPPQRPASAPAEHPRQDTEGGGVGGEHQRPDEPGEAARASHPCDANAPRTLPDTPRTSPRSPRRGPPRRSPALSGAGTGRPIPRRPEDGER
jgi:hypothetical protein